MLNFQKNPYDVFKALQIAMGTDPEPLWMLIFDKSESTYSAINFKDKQDVFDYALRNNLFSVCLVDPAQLMQVLNYDAPHDLCSALHEWCVFHRPHPDEIGISDFIPLGAFVPTGRNNEGHVDNEIPPIEDSGNGSDPNGVNEPDSPESTNSPDVDREPLIPPEGEPFPHDGSGKV